METHTVLWIGRVNMVKMSILPKLICRFIAIPIKILASFFEIEMKLFQNLGMGPQIAKTFLTKKNKIGGITLPDIKADCIAAVIKTMWGIPWRSSG